MVNARSNKEVLGQSCRMSELRHLTKAMTQVLERASTLSSESPRTPYVLNVPNTPTNENPSKPQASQFHMDIMGRRSMQRRSTCDAVVLSQAYKHSPPCNLQPMPTISNPAEGSQSRDSPIAMRIQRDSQEPHQSDSSHYMPDHMKVPSVEHCTTVMMKNIPNQYTQRMLYDVCKMHGFEGCIDLLYLPMNFSTKGPKAKQGNMGYSFLNFIDPQFAVEFKQIFDQCKLPHFRARRNLECSFSKVQGFIWNLKKLRSSNVTSEHCPPEFQPLIFDRNTGLEIPFLVDPNVDVLKIPSRRDRWSHKLGNDVVLIRGEETDRYNEMVQLVRAQFENAQSRHSS